MKLKRLTGKRKTGKGRIAAVLALAVLLGAAPAIKTDAYPAGPYTVTLKAPESEEYADLVNAKVTVDVYEVARADAQDGTDAYTLTFEGYGFEAAEEDYITNIQEPSEKPDGKGVMSADVDAFAQKLEEIALNPENSIPHGSAAMEDETFPATVTIGEAGMYLLIPHGADDYIYESEGKDSNYKATTANGNSKQYIFAPILITVPNRGQSSLVEDGYIDPSVFGDDFNYPIEAGNTANRDDWDFEGDEKKVEITLKIGWKDLNTEFLIDKMLLRHETMNNRQDKATFIYRIDAIDSSGENVFSDVRSITVSEPDKRISADPIKNIPVGSKVTVTEEYVGGDYNFAGISVDTPDEEKTAAKSDKQNRTVTFTAIPVQGDEENPEVVVLHFENNYNETSWKDGGSVTNKFSVNEESGEWELKQTNVHPTTGTEE